MTLWDKILATPQSLVGENISEDSLCFPINYQVSLTYSFVVKILSQQVCQFLTYAYADFFPNPFHYFINTDDFSLHSYRDFLKIICIFLSIFPHW